MSARRDINGLRPWSRKEVWGNMGEVHRWLIGTVIGVLGLIVALLAWLYPRAPASSQESVPAPSASSETAESTIRPASTAGKFRDSQLQIGDCIVGPIHDLDLESNVSWQTSIPVVPCSRGH